MPNSIISDAKRKAKQLENFDYKKRSKETEEDGSSGEGHEASEKKAAAMEFLHKFRKLPIEKMNKEELQKNAIPLLKQYGFDVEVEMS